MSLLRAFAARVRGVFGSRGLDARLEEELATHLAMLAEDFERRGLTPVEARRAARLSLGGLEPVKEAHRDERRWWWVDAALQDLRHAARGLRHRPGFTVAAVVLLAVGIGGNAAVFTLVDALLLRTLPVGDPARLVALEGRHQGGWGLVSFPMYRDLRERQRVFTDILATAGVNALRITIPSAAGPPADLDNVRVGLVTGNYFTVLDVRPALGRFFTDANDGPPDSSRRVGSVIVLGDDFWRQHFGRDPGVLGRTVVVGHSPCMVIGVAPPGFSGETVGMPAAAWVPLVPFSSAENLENREGTFTAYMARLRGGVRREQAEAAMTLLYQQLRVAEGRSAPDRGRIEDDAIALAPASTGIDSFLRRTFARPLGIVMAVAGLVLVVAGANVANLFLARVAARRSELGVRLAIGCSRRRLGAQLLTESLLLSVMGAVASVGVALAGSRLLLHLVSFGPVPITLDLGMGPRVLLFLAAVTVVAGVGVGVGPALHATRIDVAPALKDALRRAAGPRSSRWRLSRALVVAQVAASLVLITVAGLLVQSLRNLHGIARGFRGEHVVMFDLTHDTEDRDPEALARVAMRAQQRVAQVPGVQSASVSGLLLFGRSDIGAPLTIRGYSPAPDERPMARFNSVSPGYFETVGMMLREGRGIEGRDRAGAPLVAVVNEAMARRYFPRGQAIGGFMEITPEGRPMEIVGVVRDAKYNDLRADPEPMFYVPIAQLARPLRSLEVRTAAPASAIAAPVRAALAEVSRDLMVRRVVTLSDQVDQSLAAERLVMGLCGLFGALALGLACVGLYGVMSYGVAQRTAEIGIRIAIGATPPAVVWLVLRETLRVVLFGVVVGVGLALASTRLVSGFLYGLTARDPGTITLATVLLLAAAGVAAYLPARRAARVDPLVALRGE